jgi:hypothetical protein
LIVRAPIKYRFRNGKPQMKLSNNGAMSAIGTSRRFAAPQNLSAFGQQRTKVNYGQRKFVCF